MEINYTFYFFAFLRKMIKKLLTFCYWKSDCMDVISQEGKVYPQEQDSTVRLKAELAYDEYQWETATTVTVKNQSAAIDKSE